VLDMGATELGPALEHVGDVVIEEEIVHGAVRRNRRGCAS
jgi:hypothetical protein